MFDEFSVGDGAEDGQQPPTGLCCVCSPCELAVGDGQSAVATADSGYGLKLVSSTHGMCFDYQELELLDEGNRLALKYEGCSNCSTEDSLPIQLLYGRGDGRFNVSHCYRV